MICITSPENIANAGYLVAGGLVPALLLCGAGWQPAGRLAIGRAPARRVMGWFAPITNRRQVANLPYSRNRNVR
jgi:hypothetical protein